MASPGKSFLSTSTLDIGIDTAPHKRTTGLSTTGHDIGTRWGAVPSRNASQAQASSSLGPRRSPTMRRTLGGPQVSAVACPSRTTSMDWSATWKAETSTLKGMSSSQSSLLGFEPSQFHASSFAHRKFSPEEVREARGQMSAHLKEDLRAVHYKLGEDTQDRVPFKIWESTRTRQDKWVHEREGRQR
mmetsp:Transcript_94844/g.283240  ORF Transcript_94844/g.283240 Transcript_94844/m.283240 type:complete len:187 (+) Transcript_94844:69-629(+)